MFDGRSSQVTLIGPYVSVITRRFRISFVKNLGLYTIHHHGVFSAPNIFAQTEHVRSGMWRKQETVHHPSRENLEAYPSEPLPTPAADSRRPGASNTPASAGDGPLRRSVNAPPAEDGTDASESRSRWVGRRFSFRVREPSKLWQCQLLQVQKRRNAHTMSAVSWKNGVICETHAGYQVSIIFSPSSFILPTC